MACQHSVEGIVSNRIHGRYEPDRRTWLKTKCLNREEFVVVGWSDPEGSRHRIGSLLLGYYTPDGKLNYAGRVGTFIDLFRKGVSSIYILLITAALLPLVMFLGVSLNMSLHKAQQILKMTCCQRLR